MRIENSKFVNSTIEILSLGSLALLDTEIIGQVFLAFDMLNDFYSTTLGNYYPTSCFKLIDVSDFSMTNTNISQVALSKSIPANIRSFHVSEPNYLVSVSELHGWDLPVTHRLKK